MNNNNHSLPYFFAHFNDLPSSTMDVLNARINEARENRIGCTTDAEVFSLPKNVLSRFALVRYRPGDNDAHIFAGGLGGGSILDAPHVGRTAHSGRVTKRNKKETVFVQRCNCGDDYTIEHHFKNCLGIDPANLAKHSLFTRHTDMSNDSITGLLDRGGLRPLIDTVEHLYTVFNGKWWDVLIPLVNIGPNDPTTTVITTTRYLPSAAMITAPGSLPPIVRSVSTAQSVSLEHFALGAMIDENVRTTAAGRVMLLNLLVSIANGFSQAGRYNPIVTLARAWNRSAQNSNQWTANERKRTIDEVHNEKAMFWAAGQTNSHASFSRMNTMLDNILIAQGASDARKVTIIPREVHDLIHTSEPMTTYSKMGPSGPPLLNSSSATHEIINGYETVTIPIFRMPPNISTHPFRHYEEIGEYYIISKDETLEIPTLTGHRSITFKEAVSRVFYFNTNGTLKDFPAGAAFSTGGTCFPYVKDGAGVATAGATKFKAAAADNANWEIPGVKFADADAHFDNAGHSTVGDVSARDDFDVLMIRLHQRYITCDTARMVPGSVVRIEREGFVSFLPAGANKVAIGAEKYMGSAVKNPNDIAFARNYVVLDPYKENAGSNSGCGLEPIIPDHYNPNSHVFSGSVIYALVPKWWSKNFTVTNLCAIDKTPLEYRITPDFLRINSFPGAGTVDAFFKISEKMRSGSRVIPDPTNTDGTPVPLNAICRLGACYRTRGGSTPVEEPGNGYWSAEASTRTSVMTRYNQVFKS